MIASRTIQHNGDRTYDISFILLSHNKENDQKMRFRDLKCRKRAQHRNLREKLSKAGPVEKFWLWSKSMVNGQQRSKSTVNNAQLSRGAWEHVRHVRVIDDTWRHVKRVLMRPKLQPACGDACDVVSGRSWLGFARDWLFCHSMPLLWQLDEQNDDIRE